MANPAKRKGDAAELEAARLLADLTGWPVERKLGAGRKEDTGDLYGVPDTTIQVKNRGTYDRVPTYLTDLRNQQANAGTTFAALLLRRRGGRYIAVMDLDQLATLLREATTPELAKGTCTTCGEPTAWFNGQWWHQETSRDHEATGP